MGIEGCDDLDYYLPTRIRYGFGRVRELGEIAAGLGTRALVVTTPGIPHTERVQRILAGAGVEPVVYDRAEPNPTAASVDAAGEAARETERDMVIGVGGGSSMDTAKGAAVMAVNHGSCWEYTIEYRGQRREIEREPLPIVAVPTTAGTGSEVNFIAVLSNRETGQKGPVRSDLIRPAYAVIDPELTVTMPASVTASTGFDAMTHAFERLFAGRRHPYVDMLTENVIGTVIAHLPRVLARPDDVEARARMSWAATQGALCVLAPMGQSGLHVFGLAVSAVLDAVHGLALAAVMPTVLEDLARAYPERASRLAEMLGEESAAERAVPGMRRWTAEIGVDVTLRDLGADEGDLDALVRATNMDRLERSYHRPLRANDVRAVYRSALD
ncbi:MAG: iron-containing alcohol dehydrogenase [Armatimonadota bacterium]|nr:iron-containing alcohol dehydrogenase [Armatimonadota bacterium]